MGTSLSHEKEWSTDTPYDMDGPGEHDAQWEKPGIKGHTVCDSTDVKRPEQVSLYIPKPLTCTL